MMVINRYLSVFLVGAFVMVSFAGSPAFAATVSGKAELYHTKGTVELQKGNYEEAISIFQKAVEADPKMGEAYYLMGVAYSRLDELEKAVSLFKKALEVKPELTEVHFDYGLALYKLGRYREALNQLKMAAQFFPKRSVVHHFLGLAQYKNGQYDPALYSLSKAMELAPQLSLTGQYYTGVIYYRKGDYPKARVAFEEAIKVGPDTSVAISAKRFIKEMDRFDRMKPWSIYAQVGFLYDTNVTLRSDELPDTALPSFIADDEDWAFLFFGVGDYKILRHPIWDVGIKLGLYDTTHLDNNAFDLLGTIPGVYADYKISSAFRFRAQYEFGYYMLDFDSFTYSHIFSSQLTWMQCPRATLVIDPSYSINEYFALPTLQGVNRSTNTLRDSENVKLGFKQYLFFNMFKRQGYARLSYNWEFNDTKSGAIAGVAGNGTDFEYTAHRVGLLVSIPLPMRFTLKPAFTYYRKDYEYVHSNLFNSAGGAVVREDNNYMGSFEIVKSLFHFMDLSLKYVYTLNDSNVFDAQQREVLDYERHIVTMSAIFRF